jgi:hypothetical protein
MIFKRSNSIRIHKDAKNNVIFQNSFVVFDKDFNIKSISEYKSNQIIYQTDKVFADNVILYYPYFDLEQKHLIPKVDHDLYLKVLALITDKVLLPASHLLETNIENINLLKRNFSNYTDNQVIITSYRKGQTTINEFVESKINEKSNINEQQRFIAEGVVNIFQYYKHSINRDVKRQSALFFDFLNNGFFGNSEHSFSNSTIFKPADIELLHKEIDKIFDKKGLAISKEDLDSIVIRLGVENKLQPFQIKKILDFSNSAYFYSGGIGTNAMIGFSNYFLQSPIPGFLSDADNGTNIFYDPEFFINVMISLDIINSENDIKNLTFEQISVLRQNSFFKLFLKEYRKLSLICYQHLNNNIYDNKAIELNLLKRIKKETLFLKRIRLGTFELTKSIITLLALPHPYNVVSALPLFMLLGDYDQFISKKIGFDDILIRISARHRPLGAFCLALKNISTDYKS